MPARLPRIEASLLKFVTVTAILYSWILACIALQLFLPMLLDGEIGIALVCLINPYFPIIPLSWQCFCMLPVVAACLVWFRIERVLPIALCSMAATG